MKSYSYRIRNGVKVYRFKERVALPSAPAALEEGRLVAWALLYERSAAVRDRSAWRVEIVDETGRTLVVLPFAHLLEKTKRRTAQPESKAATWG
jgi:hypothetical protein